MVLLGASLPPPRGPPTPKCRFVARRLGARRRARSPGKNRQLERDLEERLRVTCVVKGLSDVGRNFRNRLREARGRMPQVVLAILTGNQAEDALEASCRLLRDPQPVSGALVLVDERDNRWGARIIVVRQDEPRLIEQLQDLFPDAALEEVEGEASSEATSVPDEPEEQRLDLPDLKVLAGELYLPEEWFVDLQWMLQDDKQRVVFYGPPGTGKTYIARRIAEHLQPDTDLRRVVQLHPSYGYEDFFEGYRPQEQAGGMVLELRFGPLRELVELARDNPDEPAVLLLDEMNRGNLPRVFGELFYLLEYGDDTTRLMYRPDESFALPKNLFMLGTMNTADRSIAQLDQALRRRFHFVGLFSGEPPVDAMLRSYLKENCAPMQWVADMLDLANEKLGDRNIAIGPSHLMREDLDETVLRRVWEHSVIPTIEDHFFGERERLEEFQLSALRASLGRARGGQ